MQKEREEEVLTGLVQTEKLARGRERKEWRDVESQKGKERDNKTAVNESQPAVQTD